MIILRRFAALRAKSVGLALTAAILVWAGAGCSKDEQSPVPAASKGEVEVVGELVALQDDRPVDGGIDLTLQTSPSAREIVRVPSAFIAGPRDSVLAMHQVVDATKVGDRLRARGTRDETGALRPILLELVSKASSP